MSDLAIALNRFGLGARPDEPVLAEPRRWLTSQFDKYEVLPAPWKPVERTSALVEVWLAQQRAVRQAPEGQRSGIREAYLRKGRDEYIAAVGARTSSALQASAPFVERLVHFWSNHFAVSVDKLLVVGMAGGFEADAIRPNVLGHFEDLLLAVARHPAMLLYLDQAQSLGPNSSAGQRAQSLQQRGRGLNENLAREILELHTLGVRSGYTQDDVTEFARALTGWTLPSDEPGEETKATFRFVRALHEPGARTVLGRSYADGGEQQAHAIIHDLVLESATARHIATKLARHFVADDPPPALVQRLADTFARTGGDLSSVYRALVASPEAWQPVPAKFKSPWDWGISSLRAMGRREMPETQSVQLMNQLGQPVWRPGSPAGYGDLALTWAAPDALVRRVETAQRFAEQAGDDVDARTLAPRVLPDGALSEKTAGAIARADSSGTALALLLVAPEFLRR
ncbi:DUF1800 domain-containing protein [Variovorax sp. J31P207]|uniref:DUF1800 domain-containing protein n=1 Tax=Variovorax sp. J31P207 TaxID=3053510 RepID=UPI00257641F0|nr:DUF1800 domain-containing protein [Variovorax sp. J31P207]MDM0065278.1 DUF1800 domain-containing protein [Variovorax sp. J31P207]